MTRQLNCNEAIGAVHEGYPQDDCGCDWDSRNTAGCPHEPRIVVHTFLGFMGADWDRDDVIREIHKHPQSLFAAEPGTMAWGTGHRLFIAKYTERGTSLAIETREGAFEAVRA